MVVASRYHLPILKVVVEMTALAVVMILVMILKQKRIARKIVVMIAQVVFMTVQVCVMEML